MDRRCGRWLLGRVIATGAWAEVRAGRPADHVDADAEPVAIKRPHLHAARDPAFAALFTAERALTAALPTHPALIAAIDHGVEVDARTGDERPYLVMPRVDGPDLRARLGQGAIARPVWLAVVAQVAGALAHLHAHGWVHGDVNPANVLLGPAGAVLCDLGVARTALTAGPVRGTAAYMAPEQVKGEAWTAAVDVFALGVVVWELAAGARLFARSAPYLAMAAVVESDAPRLADASLAGVVAGALARQPADRPTAADVAAALAALL